jgi:hypothetical protein
MVEINERRGMERKIRSGWIFSHKLKKQLHCIPLPFKILKRCKREKMMWLNRKISRGRILSHKQKKLHCIALPFKKFQKDAKERKGWG